MSKNQDPTYYNYKLIFNSKITEKTRDVLRLLFFLVLFSTSIVMFFLQNVYSNIPQDPIIITLQIMVALGFAALFHQLLHGIAYLFLGIKPQIRMMSTIGLPGLKWSSERMLVKRNYIFVLNTPMLFGSALYSLLMILLPTIWFFGATLFVTNLALSAVDFYWIWKLRTLHPAVVIASSKHGFNVYKV